MDSSWQPSLFALRGVHFDATDYWAPTPDWALYGSEEACPLPRDIDIFVQRAAKSCRRHLC